MEIARDDNQPAKMRRWQNHEGGRFMGKVNINFDLFIIIRDIDRE